MERRSLLFAGAVVAIAGSSFFWSFSGKSVVALSLNSGDQKMVSLGSKKYQQYCASCHGVNLEGQPNWQTRLENGRLPAPPHDKSGHTWHHTDALLFKITKQGTKAVVGDDYETDMRGFSAELSDDQIIAVLSYIKSTWPAEIRKRHDQMNKR